MARSRLQRGSRLEPASRPTPTTTTARSTPGLQAAAAHLPRVDAIGGSSAGIYIDNRPMVASLFRGVPADRLTPRSGPLPATCAGMGRPARGDQRRRRHRPGRGHVAGRNCRAGHRHGLQRSRRIRQSLRAHPPWLTNSPSPRSISTRDAPGDEWSGDQGVGASTSRSRRSSASRPGRHRCSPPASPTPNGWYMSKICSSPAIRAPLRFGNAWASSSATRLAHYADFYTCAIFSSLAAPPRAAAATLILDNALRVLRHQFPDLAERLNVQLPDEKSRRVGQSIAAASLPERVL